MWASVILATLQSLPTIIGAVEKFSGTVRRSSAQKKAMATEVLKETEGVAESEALAAARSALIDAQVAYANLLQAAVPPAK